MINLSSLFNLCIFDCAKYGSALTPPKPTKHAVSGSKTQTINNREACGPVEGRRRVCSLTYYSSGPAHRHALPRRSLHNAHMRSQLNWSLEKELKKRRRLAGFDQSYGELKTSDSDSDPESGETTETDVGEWKQVSDRKDVGSQWLLLFWQMFNTEYVHAHILIFPDFTDFTMIASGHPDSGCVVE